MRLKRRDFGTLWTGERVSLYVLKAGDRTVCVSDWGATLVSFLVPRSGGWDDLLLGFPSLEGYLANGPYFGATVGRYANRLAGASFVVEGERYELEANDGANCLHGGFLGLHRRLWQAEPLESPDSVGVHLSIESPDGEGGFPGDLLVSVEYRLDSGGTLTIRHLASASTPTPVSLTNHAYWNLAGSGTILDHELELRASRYLELGSGLVPTGRILSVDDIMDFRVPKPIGRDCQRAGLAEPRGYDHFYLVDGADSGSAALTPVATVQESVSGRRLSLSTTLPGLQFYSGNFLDGLTGKPGRPYAARSGFCLEPSLYPDAPNRPEFPQAILRPGEVYDHSTSYRVDL